MLLTTDKQGSSGGDVTIVFELAAAQAQRYSFQLPEPIFFKQFKHISVAPCYIAAGSSPAVVIPVSSSLTNIIGTIALLGASKHHTVK